VRVALGADRRDVLALVLRQAMSLVLAGLVVGLPLAWAASRLLGGFLLGDPADPLPFIGAATLLVAVALAATWVPARRAMSVDPVAAMRVD
jgi:ABC-type antimicrobial peptide transport system permease subunit